MSKLQFIPLFLSNLIIFTIGNGLLPLLPIYAGSLDATPTYAGIYLALSYFMLALGTFLTGSLVGRFNNKWLFFSASVGNVLALFLMGYVVDFWQAALLTPLSWFFGGILATMIHIQTGRLADPVSRGKTFSRMYLALPLGAIAGGLLIGRFVQEFGFGATFQILSVLQAGVIPMAFLSFEVKTASISTKKKMDFPPSFQRLAPPFHLFLLIVLFFNITLFTSRLGTSLSMQALDFSPLDISSTAAVGGLVSMPFLLTFGSISDRVGRKPILVVSYIFALGGTILLSTSGSIWQFGLVSAGLSIATYAGGPIASALAADLLSERALSRGLALFNAMQWIAAILGFAGSGILMDVFGKVIVFRLAALLLMITIAVLTILKSGSEGPRRAANFGSFHRLFRGKRI